MPVGKVFFSSFFFSVPSRLQTLVEATLVPASDQLPPLGRLAGCTGPEVCLRKSIQGQRSEN